MEIEDSAAFGQQVVRLGLMSEAQLAEALEEAREEGGKQNPDLILLLRVIERKGMLTNWQSGKVLKGDYDGFVLGGYRLLYKVSSGSFGRVFRAEDPRTGRVVAVKVLRRRWSEDESRIELFIREGKVGLSLRHPNIVEVLSINQDPSSGQYYIAMEFVEGGNLREILQIRKTLSASEALRMTEEAASGLAYAYSRGITHRDVKLTNILISTVGEAKLVDFGLAQMFAAMGGEAAQVDRTVDYAGLEKGTGVKQGDVRSDIYFLGCVLYEALVGRPPLAPTRDRHARMRRQRFEEVRPLTVRDLDAPHSVLQLVETMMSFNPQLRYQTPSQLIEAVKLVRKELAGSSARTAAHAGAGSAAPVVRSIFIAESDERLQDAFRERLRKLGYRVFLAGDPLRALERFRMQPFDALVVDVGTTGEEGALVFERLQVEAADKGVPFVAIAILSEDQGELASKMPKGKHSTVLVRPVTIKQLHRTLQSLFPKS
jgi:CheY-like chemotaxis protein/tRNA A-37 threonylcarbamoyl transferase component Bud32